MKSLLIGESASDADELAIVGAIQADPQVRSLIHLRTEHIGPEELLVGAKIDFDPALTMPELAVGIDRVEAAIRAGGADGPGDLPRARHRPVDRPLPPTPADGGRPTPDRRGARPDPLSMARARCWYSSQPWPSTKVCASSC